MKDYKRYFKGYNFMTPYILDRGEAGSKFIYELSRGIGIDAKYYFGLTIFDLKINKIDYSLSHLCFSTKEAYNYIEQLKEES